MNYLTILDGGHGLETQGKRTPIFPDDTLLKENEFNDDIVMRVYNKLNKVENMDVAFTAEENYDVPLNTRVIRANRAWAEHQEQFGKENSKCILISIHANAYGNGKTFNNAKGVETYCCSTPPEERVLAETIHKHLKGGTTQIDRGVQEICFAILKGNMTSCLVECAFMTNLDEANLLKQEAFRQECADEIVAGILEYFGIEEKKEVDNVVRYKKYNDRIHELRGNAEQLTAEIVNKKIWDITEFTNCVNGTFYWYEDEARTKTYATSPLVIDGIVYQRYCNHKLPQSVFAIYKDGTVSLQRVTDVYKLKDFKNVRLAVGGVGLRNTQDSNFRYSPVSEGFSGKFADVLRQANKTVLGYSKTLNKVYLLAVKNATHAELLKIISDNSTGEAYDIAISLDGGGSTLMDALGKYVVQGQNSRRIHNILRFI